MASKVAKFSRPSILSIMNHQLRLKIATVDDTDALQALYVHLSKDNESYSSKLAKRNLVKLSQYEGSCVLVGEIDNVIIVSRTLVIVPNLTRGGASSALIENVVTHSDYRGLGYGKLILDAASNRAWEHDCYKIILTTGSTKPSTLDFYESAGFEQSRTGFQKRRIAVRTE